MIKFLQYGLGFLLGYLAYQFFVHGDTPKDVFGWGEVSSAWVQEEVDKANELFPFKADKFTRIDGVEWDDPEIRYNYTILILDRNQALALLASMDLDGAFKMSVCENSVNRRLLKSGFPIIFSYRDENGGLLQAARAEPQDCGFQSN